MASSTASDEPDCEASSFKRLSLYGGLCVGVGCGASEYRLNASVDTPTGVYTERFSGSLSVAGSKWWNRSLKAAAKSYQTGFRSESTYRADLAIQEPVDGPIEGRYTVTFWLRDERQGGSRVCVLRRENAFTDRFDSTETPPGGGS
ncbi:hypothetical protein GCM10025759_32590 [Lysobacter panacisoli]|uniref:Lipoprotein n=2 Tax=Lysobacter panacisoli TaxID=1255263 RepID=A0ABP9LN00_9GAMM